ncbi:MAG: hypothetical protein IPO83_03850 [Chitinophagaceae bacterium]|nr:hypothetical protein [Chitinophagaceae bacterium]
MPEAICSITKVQIKAILIPYYSVFRSIDCLAEERANELISSVLEKVIKYLPIKNKPACLISGGVDSSIVAILVSKNFGKPQTLSLGFPDHNEFPEASRFARSRNFDYDEYIVNENELEQSFIEVISCVEHYHSIYVEYLTPVHIGNKVLLKDFDSIVSGYGSDIIFGGFAKRGNSFSDISTQITSEYKTSLWSAETSMALANFYNKEIYYPYYDSEVIDLAFRISTNLKFKNNIEKYILRTSFKDVLPAETAWREKIGIHQSSGTENYFSSIATSLVGKTLKREQLRVVKDRIAFECLKLLMENKIHHSSIDFSEIKRRFNEVI